MRHGYYTLDSDGTITEVSTLEWAEWFENNEFMKHIDKDDIGNWYISTVFLGLDHSWSDSGPPVLFETMIFTRDKNGELDYTEQYMDRYHTLDEAHEYHAKVVAYIKKYNRLPESREDLSDVA